MGYLLYLKDFVTLATILSLFVVGLLISLKSGFVSVGGDRCRLIRSNLSQLIVSLVGCAIFLLMIQQIVGFRLGFSP
jgi:hypothetical protein